MALEFQINLGGNFVEAMERSSKAVTENEKTLTGAEKAMKLFDTALESTEGKLAAIKADPAKFKKLIEVQKELAKTSKELGGEEDSLKEKLESMSTIGVAGFTFDLAKGAEMALDVFKELAEAVFDLGKDIIKASGAAEDLNLAIKLDVGEEGQEKVNKLAESFGGTRFDDKLIKNSLLPILEESGDEHSDQWDDLITAATDVATRRNTGSAGAQAALGALRSIEIQPQKIRGSLKELGIKQKDFYDDLGDLLGITAASAEKQVKAGKIKSQTLLSVALNQIAEREGGSLGNATNQGAKTLGSTLERLGNLKENLFEQLANSPGMKAVQTLLDKFIDTLSGPIGTDLINKIGDSFASVFGALTSEEGLQGVENAIKAVGQGIGAAVDGIKMLVEWMSKAASVASALAAPVRPLIEFGFKMAGGGGGEDEDGGGNVVGFKNRLRELFAAGKIDQAGIAHALATGVIPAMASGGIVDGPTLALIGEAGPEAVGPLSGGNSPLNFGAGGLGGASIAIEMNIQTAATNAAELAQDLEPAIRTVIKNVLTEASMQF